MKRAYAPAMIALAATALVACSTGSSLQPSALLATDAEPVAAAAPRMLSPSPGSARATRIRTDARVRFVPVIGATDDAVAPLSRRLAARAVERGVPLVTAGGATLVVRGYFSAVVDNGETAIVFVWDVVDPAGTRVHRIQGQHKEPGTGGWTTVGQQTMEAIADRTIDELAAWLDSGVG